MKKIYFAGSIRGGRGEAGIYSSIVDELTKYGTVLTEHVGSDDAESSEHLSDKEIHDRDMDWLLGSDILVAEVTTPSLGVGYEIGRAIEHGIPTACLFRIENAVSLSAMIGGSTELEVFEYRDIKDVSTVLKRIFQAT